MVENHRLSKQELDLAIQEESKRFKEYYIWIEQHMPAKFFEQVDTESILLIVHSFMEFHVNDYFSYIHLKGMAYTLSLDSPDADLKVLRHYKNYGVKSYRAFVSNENPPFPKSTSPLRITRLIFNDAIDKKGEITQEQQREILAGLQQRRPEIDADHVEALLEQISPLFVQAMTVQRLVIALDLLLTAQTHDSCQYEVLRKDKVPSLQIVLAWRSVPQYNFLYRLASMIQRHHLAMRRVNATYSKGNVLILSLGLHGIGGKAAWEEADLDDFLQELSTLKYFEGMEGIESTFVEQGLLTGNQGNLIKSMIFFLHQALVAIDPHLYTLEQIEEALCRHPELTVQLIATFEQKFHPKTHNLEAYNALKTQYLSLVKDLDTGNLLNDKRRKTILNVALLMVEHTLKTNYYCQKKTAFSFRLDPAYLDALPGGRTEKFPELPYALFFMKGFCFTGFHIRFRDLSRGGLRTVVPKRLEQIIAERNNIFSECYNLAYTQNKKNKDIPEGGAKGVIFLEPYAHLAAEEEIRKRELEEAGESAVEIQSTEHIESLYAAQRSYIASFLTLINCEEEGQLRSSDVIDYWKRPEYIYLGPDENMSNPMIEWIAKYSTEQRYKPGSAFISSKPGAGINHKEFGVTSLGVNVYVDEILRFLGINPAKQSFNIKMSGGPDGDVAGNEINNLYKYYKKTAKLLATVDISGTILDPEGLDLPTLHQMFLRGLPIAAYPPEKLHDGGFLLNTQSKKEESAYVQKTLCTRKEKGKLKEEWLSGNEMNALLRHNVHQVDSDIFVPGGGRPRTLNESNWQEFLNAEGKPTARAIVEGANLYLTPEARSFLEAKGVLIVKDSSANKGGVICSSFEVLYSLVLSEEEFLREKPRIVEEILHLIEARAKVEATLLLKTYQETHSPLTEISEQISLRINLYKDQLLTYLQTTSLSNHPEDPLIRCLLNHAPPLLRNEYQERLLQQVPDVHKKAIIACHIASRIVYHRGLDWAPSLIDVLPLITQDPLIIGTR